MSDAIPFTFRKFSMLVDGTIRMIVDVEPNDAQGVFTMFKEPNLPGAMVRLNTSASVTERQTTLIEQTHTGDYGEEARQLRLSGFFRCQGVWPEIGTDEEFLAWIRTQKCVVCGTIDPDEYGQHEECYAAHVRRVANGSGTGIKPRYSAVPMCYHHHQKQHQKGESAVGGKEFLDKKRIEMLEKWGWETLKAKFGYEHWNEIRPIYLAEWAKEHGIYHLLPNDYKVLA